MTWLFITMMIATLVAITKILLNKHNISYINRRQDQVPSEFTEKISLAEHQKAAQYSIAKLRFSNINILYGLLLLSILLVFGLLNWFNQIVSTTNTGPIVSGLILFIFYSLFSTLLSLPMDYYSTFVLEEKFGFNRTTKKIFFIDLFKNLLLGTILGSIMIGVLIFIMEKVTYWWLIGWIATMLFQFILMWAYPRFIAPLFNKFNPLTDEILKDKVEKLLNRANIKFKDFFVMNASIRSSHGNAYFTGFGKNRRIVFFDTLLKSLKNEQVEAVLAHELGHLKHKHILKSLILATLGSLLFFLVFYYLYNKTNFTLGHNIDTQNPAVFLILASLTLPIYTFFLTPIFTWFSRKNEYEADSFASEYSNGEHLIDALLALYRDNSSTLTPAKLYWKFYYSHPPAIERFKHIKSLSFTSKQGVS